MKTFYSLYQALDFLKWQISEYEKKQKKAKQAWEKQEFEEMIEWLFERGINLIQFTKPEEIEPDVIDYFLNRKAIRPDLIRAREILDAKWRREKRN